MRVTWPVLSTACGGRIYSNKLNNLEIGAPVFYYQKGTGCLGYGRVATAKMPASEFVLEDGETLVDKLPVGYLIDCANDPDNASYVVGIDWKKTVDGRNAKAFAGIFANQNVVCKIYGQETADFLQIEFEVSDEDEML